MNKIPMTYQILTNLNCNLACSYCYECRNNKVNTKEKITEFLQACFERDKDKDCTVFVELIGGESLLYPDLVDHIVNETIELSEKYGKKINGIGLSTNGTLLDKPEVQEVLLKHRRYINIGVSIDGPEDVHDKHRRYIDGRGSYKDIIKNLPWLFVNFPKCRVGVKATFNHETADRYAESVIHLIELGFRKISANFVFEEKVEGKPVLTQLLKIADYLIDNDLMDKVEFFQLNRIDLKNFNIFKFRQEDKNYCGSTVYMTCLGFDGKVYGCNRFCTMNKENMEIGELEDTNIKITNQKLIDEVACQYKLRPEECVKCELRNFCPTCAAAPYEEESVEEYLKEKRMCDWTYAISIVRHYCHLKLNQKG